MDKQTEHVIRAVEERDVRFVRLWFTDVLGTIKSVAIAPAELEAAFGEGIGFDGSCIEGLTRVYEADMLLAPDPATFQILPWKGNDEVVARMFCDVLTPDGQMALSASRNILKRTLEKAEDMGFTCYAHPEIEFYLFERSKNATDLPRPIDRGGYFDHVAHTKAHDFRRLAITTLEEMGILVEFSHHEAGPGQQEIDIRVADVLTTADNIQTFRTLVQEIALGQDAMASFMPKPLPDQPGSGMHTHLSLFEGDKNAFYDPAGEFQLSRIGRHFIAGLLRHAPEITALTNQHVNSYKRLWGGDEAPSYVCWGHNNRSALVRVPIHKPGKARAVRVEYRALDAAANPYLAFAIMIRAGIKGIEAEYELPPAINEDVAAMTDLERQVMGIASLPQSLHNAVELVKQSDLVAETLGEDAFEYFIRNKTQEWTQYRKQITAFELNQFLPVI